MEDESNDVTGSHIIKRDLADSLKNLIFEKPIVYKNENNKVDF